MQTCTAVKETPPEQIVQPITMLGRLESARALAESRTAGMDDAIAYLKENPRLANVLDVMIRTGAHFS